MISDSVKATAGMTPRLFMATVLAQYGWIVAQEVFKSGRTLVSCDKKLQAALVKLRVAGPGSSDDVTAEIGQMNETLINMNINLTGTRSTMHYLAESAHTLINGVSTFEHYIQARLSEWEGNSQSEDLKKALRGLDSCKESIRDNDKLELVRKTMGQYKIDIKSLQQHIDISVGMVHNLIAERDKVIQNVIAGNTSRDGFEMKIIAVLTIFFLPGTYMAIFLASPVFDFKSTESVIVALPSKLYWSIAGGVTLLLLIGQFFLTFPEWTVNAIEFMHLSCLKNSRLYKEEMTRKQEKDKQMQEKNSVVRRRTDDSEANAQNTIEQGQSKKLDNDMNGQRRENGLQESRQGNGLLNSVKRGQLSLIGDNQV
ncbi:hypothetical protein NA56DRAFT_148498 [Hyaloscypha hepaticicola]|uniref:Uncharacterized protein n=1 Tax=Hyaloscypha hepaticicola TaxID=2082293 RepID=A0A2J6QNJ5_9HELO|nr:hypothetical protein NA56DRAFT_148498 [Hyaloscypha hepaticicola]